MPTRSSLFFWIRSSVDVLLLLLLPPLLPLEHAVASNATASPATAPLMSCVRMGSALSFPPRLFEAVDEDAPVACARAGRRHGRRAGDRRPPAPYRLLQRGGPAGPAGGEDATRPMGLRSREPPLEPAEDEVEHERHADVHNGRGGP